MAATSSHTVSHGVTNAVRPAVSHGRSPAVQNTSPYPYPYPYLLLTSVGMVSSGYSKPKRRLADARGTDDLGLEETR